METFSSLLLAVFLSLAGLRLLFYPVGWLWKLLLHGASGFLCLWLLNTAAPFIGFSLPINAVTVLLSGFLGLPGIGGLALLEWLC